MERMDYIAGLMGMASMVCLFLGAIDTLFLEIGAGIVFIAAVLIIVSAWMQKRKGCRG